MTTQIRRPPSATDRGACVRRARRECRPPAKPGGPPASLPRPAPPVAPAAATSRPASGSAIRSRHLFCAKPIQRDSGFRRQNLFFVSVCRLGSDLLRSESRFPAGKRMTHRFDQPTDRHFRKESHATLGNRIFGDPGGLRRSDVRRPGFGRQRYPGGATTQSAASRESCTDKSPARVDRSERAGFLLVGIQTADQPSADQIGSVLQRSPQ